LPDEPDWRRGGFGVYVHWPFCAAKCPYCDFNSHVRAQVDQTRWARALCRDIEATAARCPDRVVDSIFFGGGTPSLMAPETVGAVLEKIGAVWTLADTCEISMEANPTSVEAGRFRAYGALGVSRLSMGIQSLIDADLKALGRLHSAAEARQAFDIARDIFPRVSFDLIYARQNQGLEAWEAELTAALDMAIDHLSLYQLTIEEGTRFGALHDQGRLRGLPEDSLAARMYARTAKICAAKGLLGYEISNHARPGAECRHNLVYWRYGDYAGIGPGAHGRLTLAGARLATETRRMPEDWLTAVEQTGTGVHVEEPIAPEDQAREYLMMSLRLSEGTDPRRYAALGGTPLPDRPVAEMVGEGFLETHGAMLRATPRGQPLLNAILGRLLT